jgi:hypothetical protein
VDRGVVVRFSAAAAAAYRLSAQARRGRSSDVSPVSLVYGASMISSDLYMRCCIPGAVVEVSVPS